MLSSAALENSRMLQVVGTSTAVPDATPVVVAPGNGNRVKVRVAIVAAAVYDATTAPALAYRTSSGVVRLHTFGLDEMSVELCALEYGSAVTGPLLGIGSAAGAFTFHVTSVELNQEPVG